MSRNVPKLRFKGFEDEWKEKKMALLGTFLKGNGISKSDLSESGKECILYGELYTTYGEVIESIKSKTDISLKNEVLSKINDVIIPSSGESAIDIATASCVMKDNILLGGDLNVFRPNKDNGVFISYQLNNSKKKDIAKIAQGASVVHIYNEQLKQLKVNIPSLEEQEKIANFLSKVDSIIEKQEKKVQYWNSYKKGMMQKIFSQKIRFKDDNGRDYPEWKEKKLGEICIIVMGQSPSSASYNDDNIGVPLVQGNADIYNKITKPRLYTSEITKICNENDIIMSVRAPVGSIAIADRNCCIGRGVCAIKSKENQSFLYQFLLDKEDKWGKISQGSTFESINSNDIKRLKIMIPNIKEQEKIAEFLLNIDSLVEKETKELEELRILKKGLLQQIFI
ncbi:TPA: restriction endonuclease subunit S [Clostridium perfringens]|nr:restriction endonuclease subunit S [Clostridium perfringens]